MSILWGGQIEYDSWNTLFGTLRWIGTSSGSWRLLFSKDGTSWLALNWEADSSAD